MTNADDMQLYNIDPEDIEDAFIKVGKSFGIRLLRTTLEHAKTFGDVCDAIESQLNFADKDDCTAQQAFYKIRKAISEVQHIDEKSVKLESELKTIFPRLTRIRDIKRFKRNIGIPVKFLDIKNWLEVVLLFGILISLISIFFNWRIGVVSLASLLMFRNILSRFSKELRISTVRELVELISREHYYLARRHRGSFNSNEVAATIQKMFMADLFLKKEVLTRDAVFAL